MCKIHVLWFFCYNLNLLHVLSHIHCAVSSQISVGSVSLLYEAVVFGGGDDDCWNVSVPQVVRVFTEENSLWPCIQIIVVQSTQHEVVLLL